MTLRQMTRVLAALACAFAAQLAPAQDYPARAIRIVAPQVPGGPNDVLARVLAERMQDGLRQAVVVDNKPGAGGMLAASEVARAPADGYTALLITASLISGAHLIPNAPVDPLKDLVSVAMVTFTPLVLAVNARALPAVRTFQDLVAHAKANPGKLNIGVSGAGGADHLAAEMINRRTGMNIQAVIYKGAAPATQDLVAGRVELEITTYGFLKPYVDNGTLRVLASPGRQRNPFAPDAPTVAELGYPDVDVPTWTGFMLPAGTPRPIVARLGAEIRQALQSPQVTGRLGALSLVANYADADQFGAILRTDSERMRQLIKEANIKLQ